MADTSLPDVNELALQLVALAEVEARVKDARNAIKEQLQQQLEVGDVKRPRVPGGDKRRTAGTVSYSAGRVSASVTDREALAQYLAANYPESVELQLVPADWQIKAILDMSAQVGQACMPDGTLDVPGVEVREGAAYLSARRNAKLFDDEWRAIIAPTLNAITAETTHTDSEENK